jgi:hypothetical protein
VAAPYAVNPHAIIRSTTGEVATTMEDRNALGWRIKPLDPASA